MGIICSTVRERSVLLGGVILTRYIAAYDTEKAGDCLAACWQIRRIHERLAFPATFFITGERLEAEGTQYLEALGPHARGDAPLFEIASHLNRTP